ncbi:hypothetical protein [Runella sp. SP2]|uniref:hypothetical protein n=1 Tax=Runella sp. SP2 TaxID=2268026 RepID=UPI000F09905C|nr:hypothetical protein [Runella sp. SP2]AYQ31981.1 hypothetical protein DTQ70_07250 [Runella sp. SP2]
MRNRNNEFLIWALIVLVVVILWFILRDKLKWVTTDTTTPRTTAKTATEQTRSYSGTSTHSGTGTATSFSVPHLLGEKPVFVQITATSNDAGNYDHVEADTKLITVFYKVAPPEGVNNVTFNWFASL